MAPGYLAAIRVRIRLTWCGLILLYLYKTLVKNATAHGLFQIETFVCELATAIECIGLPH